jgi:hypothetical protein
MGTAVIGAHLQGAAIGSECILIAPQGAQGSALAGVRSDIIGAQLQGAVIGSECVLVEPHVVHDLAAAGVGGGHDGSEHARLLSHGRKPGDLLP